MAAAAESRLPRWLIRLCYPFAALALTLVFIVIGFPYDRLAVRLEQEVQSTLDMRLRIGELSPQLGLGGLGIAAREVLAKPEVGPTIVIQELVLRPAWSLAWFRGQPAIYVDMTSEMGSASGIIIVGSTGPWQGKLEAVQLDALPLEMIQALDMDGSLDATFDLRRAPPEQGGQLEGQMDFELRDGSFRSEGLPLTLPVERLQGRLNFGGESYVTLSEVALEGPLLEGTLQGGVGHAQTLGNQSLAIDLSLRVRDEGLAGLLSGMSNPGDDGFHRLQVTGTIAKPTIR